MRVQRGADGTILNAAVLTAEEVTRQRVLCPACMSEVFETWPEGWESHAADSCEAVERAAPDQRKAEFRRVLGHLFHAAGEPSTELVSLDELVGFARTLAGRLLHTPARDTSFTVMVDERGLIYTPEGGGRPRFHPFARVRTYLDEFSRSGSLEPSAYHPGGNLPYMLTLLRLFTRRTATAHPRP